MSKVNYYVCKNFLESIVVMQDLPNSVEGWVRREEGGARKFCWWGNFLQGDGNLSRSDFHNSKLFQS